MPGSEDGRTVMKADEESTSKLDKSSSKTGAWQCSICTYENDQYLVSCDVCGVFRDFPGKSGSRDEENVNGTSKKSEVSPLGRSLFDRPPNSMPKVAGGFLCNEAGKSCGARLISAQLGDLHKMFLAPSLSQTKNIEPFRFDAPSPDDIVSSGKSSRTFPKVNTMPSTSVKISHDKPGKKGLVEVLQDNEVPESFPPSSLPNNHNEFENDNPSSFEDEPHMLANNVQSLKLEKHSPKSRNVKAKSNAEYKPEEWMFPDKEGTLSQLNLAIVGHVDSGKSTLSGRLLHLLGQISNKQMHRYEREAKQKGKGSFAYAWALDESVEERERGITMTVAVAYFLTKKYRVVLLDSPGHRDFVPNMISGSTQADAAVLVIDASVGAFEAGMGGKSVGQTKEHAQLIRSFGVEQLIVAVNKMDQVDFSKDRFDYIKLQLGHFLRTCGFKESLVTWIPLSALDNQNLLTTASDIHLSCWYQGYCLLDAIDSLQSPHRDVLKPFLLPICDVISKYSSGQVTACGKIETGAIRIGSKVLVMPSGDPAVVRNIERDSSTCNVARAGDNVVASLHGVDQGQVIQGGVLCHPDFPVTIASSLELKILILDIATPIIIGSQVELHIHHAKQAAKVVKVLSLIDPKTGSAAKKSPRMLVARQRAIVEVALEGEICVEEFSNCRALGRVFLRALGSTIAVGIVTRILQEA
ncbi:uncharacterized protein LOC135582019 isoform X1 [Musa acuminata AAA Group]|uniref:uncharacterized protein LOC135582019 isoform X1 n=2 Tax=Musa acuminata AAA Group TaxID=214697 RepID=UPI0031DCA22A